MSTKIYVAVFAHLCIQSILFRKYGTKGLSGVLPLILIDIIRLLVSAFRLKKRVIFKRDIFVLSVIYQLQNLLLWRYAARLSPVYITICIQTRIVHICILSLLILKMRFTYLQYLGQAIIIAGVYIPVIGKDKTNFDMEAILGILLSGFLASVGSIYFEQRIRRTIKDFWSYTFSFNSFSLLMSITLTTLDVFTGGPSLLETVKSVNLYYAVVSTSIGTMLVSYLSTNACPMRRTFFTTIISALASVFVQYLLRIETSWQQIIALGTVNAGACLYEYENIKDMVSRSVKNGISQSVK